jgi:hypothetical protein
MINEVDGSIKTCDVAVAFSDLGLAYMIGIQIFSYCHAVVEIGT